MRRIRSQPPRQSAHAVKWSSKRSCGPACRLASRTSWPSTWYKGQGRRGCRDSQAAFNKAQLKAGAAGQHRSAELNKAGALACST